MRRFSGWAHTGWVAAGLVVMTGSIFALAGWNEAAVRMLVRASARVAVVLFLLAFSASALKQLVPGPPAAWLRRNRRYVGVSFALAHFVHLGALVVLARTFPEGFDRGLLDLAGGGLAYAFIAAMTATSFDRTAAWLGARRWRLLHTAGSYYVWLIFANSYGSRALVNPVYIPVAVALLCALGLRLWVLLRKPRPVSLPQ
jgi:sulfoxide reductase heme-binding subunit YedZ